MTLGTNTYTHIYTTRDKKSYTFWSSLFNKEYKWALEETHVYLNSTEDNKTTELLNQWSEMLFDKRDSGIFTEIRASFWDLWILALTV